MRIFQRGSTDKLMQSTSIIEECEQRSGGRSGALEYVHDPSGQKKAAGYKEPLDVECW